MVKLSWVPCADVEKTTRACALQWDTAGGHRAGDVVMIACEQEGFGQGWGKVQDQRAGVGYGMLGEQAERVIWSWGGNGGSWWLLNSERIYIWSWLRNQRRGVFLCD